MSRASSVAWMMGLTGAVLGLWGSSAWSNVVGGSRDRNLWHQVTVSPGRLDLQQWATSAGGASHVSLGVLGPLAAKPGVCSRRAAELRHLMQAVSAATGAKWVRLEDSWALSDTPGIERVAALNPNARMLALSAASQQLRQFRNDQLRLLASRHYLDPRELTPAQRQALVQIASLLFATSDDVAPEALQLQGVYLKALWVPSENSNQEHCEIGVVLPRQDGDEDTPKLSIAVAGLRIQPRERGPARPFVPAPPSCPGPTPRAESSSSAAPFAKAADFDGATVLDALALVANKADANLLAFTSFGERKVSLAKGMTTLSTVLKSVEDATGGTIEVKNDIFFLHTGPVLERIRSLRPYVAEKWRTAAFAAVQTSLSDQQRETLTSAGTLTVAQLAPKQRDQLRWAASVAFGTIEGLAPECMALKGIRLQLLPEDRSRGFPRRVEYVLPALGGAEERGVRLPF